MQYVFDTFLKLSFTLVGAQGDASANVDHHLEMGKRLLAAGQLTEALSHYHLAVGMRVKILLVIYLRFSITVSMYIFFFIKYN